MSRGGRLSNPFECTPEASCAEQSTREHSISARDVEQSRARQIRDRSNVASAPPKQAESQRNQGATGPTRVRNQADAAALRERAALRAQADIIRDRDARKLIRDGLTNREILRRLKMNAKRLTELRAELGIPSSNAGRRL